jgi:pyruvate carboxylase
MNRALREFRIRGVATNLTFLEAIINHPKLPRQFLHDQVHRHDAGAVRAGEAAGPRDEAAELSRRCERQRPSRDARPAEPNTDAAAPIVPYRRPIPGSKQKLDALGPKRLRGMDARAKAGADHRHDDARRPPVAAGDPHAHA